MSTILDLVGSFIIGGLLLLMILNVNTNFNQLSTESQLTLIAQENLTELINEIEFDFRKIGYRVPVATPSIVAADTSSIAFWADIDNNGTLDLIAYVLGQPSEVSGTVNPRDRILYRSVNGQTVGGSLGVVDFQLTLFDSSGAQTANLNDVKSLDYHLMIESPFPVDTVYSSVVWNGTVYPKNL